MFKSERLWKHFLDKADPSLSDVVHAAKNLQLNASDKRTTTDTDEELLCVRSRSSSVRDRSTKRGRSQSREQRRCTECYKKHEPKFCKAKYLTCWSCSQHGHVRDVCGAKKEVKKPSLNKEHTQKRQPRVKSQHRPRSPGRRKNTFKPTQMEVDTVLNVGQEPHMPQIQLLLNGKPVTFTLDSGASVSIINLDTYRLLGKPECIPFRRKLNAYGSRKIPVKGQVLVDVKYGTVTHQLSVVIVMKRKVQNLFGFPWFNVFGLQITDAEDRIFHVNETVGLAQDICSRYPGVFQRDLGCAVNFQADLYLKEAAVPKFCKPRKLPFVQKAKVEKEINRLVEYGILKPMKFSDWATPIVVVRKPDDTVRLCGDYKVTVNPQLETEFYPIPSAEQLMESLNKGKYFTKLDLKDAYLQIPLAESTKKLLTINTHLGLFQY